jgi:pyruvate,water dikinase
MLSQEIVSKTLGTKSLSIRPASQGGVEQLPETKENWQALSDGQILELAALGSQVQSLYGFPQDIEWALSNGQLFLLQSRPITSLFPLPEGFPPEPLQVFGSFASVQGIFDPITPLGRSVMMTVAAKARNFFGMPSTEESQRIMVSAGERLWSNATGLVRNPLGRKILPGALEFVEPALVQAFRKIWDDPRLQPERTKLTLKGRLQLARLLLPLGGNVLLNLLAPVPRRRYIIRRGENVLRKVAFQSSRATGDRYEKLGAKARMVTAVSDRYFAHTIILFMSGIAAGMASWNALNHLTRGSVEGKNGKNGWGDLILQVSRGMPNNPTIEMDLLLWEMTQRIRQDPSSMDVISANPPQELAGLFLSGKLPAVAGEEVNRFLERYGARGYGEIDLGHKRWADDPTHVFEMLQSFLQIKEESKAPDVIFSRGVTAAEQAVDALAAAVRNQKGGFMRSRLVRFFAGRARQLLGIRENPKFFAVRLLRLLQVGIREVGEEFVASGELEHADDLFFLSFTELFAFSRKEPAGWRKLIRERRSVYEREFSRRQLPRLLLSDGRAFYEGMAAPSGEGDDILIGSPVSPGVIEGVVRVVLDPRFAGLIPGEIMVCPGTDPSWTPLFLAASGLVMEVGGMMTHGAVVAREYGIPAVVGVNKATERFKNGQRIRLNGSNGEITLLDS